MKGWFSALAVLVALLTVSSAVAAETPEPAGSWAVRADGRILAVLDLRRDTAAPGGWAGEWIRPEHMTFNATQVVSAISGPVVRRRIVAAAARGEAIDLTIEGPASDPAGDVFAFRLRDDGFAELGWRDWPEMSPMLLARVEAGAEPAAGWDPSGEYSLAVPARPTNAEMTAIFDADQADRRDGPSIDWAVVGPRDAARRVRTRALLDAGALQSGEDFLHAAFVFQHGDVPEDYLLAHTLAIVATARGRAEAAWIAAATLDRYLQNIGRRQIYGTQFSTPRGQPATQEPYDRTLISDALRQALGVPPQAAQERQRAEFEAAARAAEVRRR